MAATKKSVKRPQPNGSVAVEYRTKTMKIKTALVVGFKNFMIRSSLAKYADKPKGVRGIGSFSIKHSDNKGGVYKYGPNEAGDMKVTLNDIVSNIPKIHLNNLRRGTITNFTNVSVRIRSNKQGKAVQVNIHPAFTAEVTVDSKPRSCRVSHSAVVLV